jgi:hypothetical protein
MNLDCRITELLKADFNTLWRCSQLGDTLEISTPYRMPDSTLFSLFLTEREDRFIASDGGAVAELLVEHSYLPEEEWKRELSALAKTHGLKEGANEGVPIFFKDCKEEKIISSISFDVANFATMAANLLISVEEVEEQGKETDSRFQSKAHDFLLDTIRDTGRSFYTNHKIPNGPEVNFSAVIESSSNIWVVSYITGSGLKRFRSNLSDTAISFKEAWSSDAAPKIKRTIPLMNSDSRGYQPMRMRPRIRFLEDEAKESAVSWAENYLLNHGPRSLLAA